MNSAGDMTARCARPAMPRLSARHRKVFPCSVMAAESALALEPTFDNTYDFTTPHANVVQLAIAQSFKGKHGLALDAPFQIGHPPRLHPGQQLAGLGCDAL